MWLGRCSDAGGVGRAARRCGLGDAAMQAAVALAAGPGCLSCLSGVRVSLCTCCDGVQVQGVAGVSQGKATALQAIRALLHTRGPLGLMKGYWVSGWGIVG